MDALCELRFRTIGLRNGLEYGIRIFVPTLVRQSHVKLIFQYNCTNGVRFRAVRADLKKRRRTLKGSIEEKLRKKMLLIPRRRRFNQVTDFAWKNASIC